MGGGLAFEDENADKGGKGVQKGQFFADVLIECPLDSFTFFIKTRHSYYQKIYAPCGALNTWLNSVRLQNIRGYVFGNLEISSGLNAHYASLFGMPL